MDSDPKISDFEYSIHDKNGIRGFKDGKEYSISEEDWARAHPEHRTTGCLECNFVDNKEHLLTYLVRREVKCSVGLEPVFVGKFTMPGWVGHVSFYVFKCCECECVVVDYPHGYHGSFLFLRCDNCRFAIDLDHPKYLEIYKRDKHFEPFSPIKKFFSSIGLS